MSAGHLTLAGNRARFADGRNRIGGIDIAGGAVVVHGHGFSIPRTAQVRDGCGCLADCRNGSKVVVGSTWRLNLNNPSVRTTKQPRVQWELFECSHRFQYGSNTKSAISQHPPRLLRVLDFMGSQSDTTFLRFSHESHKAA